MSVLPPISGAALRGFAVVLAPQHDAPAQQRVRFADPAAWLLRLDPEHLTTVEEPDLVAATRRRFPSGCAFSDLARLVSHVVWLGVPAKVAAARLGLPAYGALTSSHIGSSRTLEAVRDPAEVLRAVRAHRTLWQDEANKVQTRQAAADDARRTRQAAVWAQRKCDREQGIVQLYVPAAVR